jgi:hypothetical protein
MFTLFTLSFALSLVIGYLGRHKKLGFWGLFFASLILTPLMGLLLLLVSAERSPERGRG